jgi:hypothetical protein
MEPGKLSEDDWKVVEARLQYDIDNNIGMDIVFGVLQEVKMKEELTTQEIFEESMKLSDLAYKEKGEKLKQYKEWLNKKWKAVE